MTMSATETVQPLASQIEEIPLDDGPVTVIRARKGWIGVNWKEMFARHELLTFLIWRDVKVKYKQAILGFAWAIFVPVIQVILFTVIGRAAGWSANFDGPYAVYVYAGLLPWLFIQAGIGNGGMSLVSQQQLLTKIYMPRLFMPTATVGTAMVDMTLSFLVFCGMMAFYGFVPSWQMVYLPLLLVHAIVLSLGFAYLLSALTVNFRDVRFLIPFLSQILMWVSAAVYPPRIFKEHADWLAINPVFGVISAFRSAILGEPWNTMAIAISIVEAIALLIFGLFYFRRVERRFADIA